VSTPSTITEALRETLIPEDSYGSDVDIDFDAPKGQAVIKKGTEQNITVRKSDGPGSSRMPSKSTIKQDSIPLTSQGVDLGYVEVRGDTSSHASTSMRAVPVMSQERRGKRGTRTVQSGAVTNVKTESLDLSWLVTDAELDRARRANENALKALFE
jgi:hypothetical protein